MKLLYTLLFISLTCYGQSKKELEIKLSELKTLNLELENRNKGLTERIQDVENQNSILDSSVNDFRNKYENTLSERINQEKIMQSLSNSIDSLKSTTNSKNTSDGVYKLIEFNNSNSLFTVPDGKKWEIVNVFSDYYATIERNRRQYDNKYKYDTTDIRILIESINNTVITDLNNKKLGTCVYRSGFTERGVRFPILLPSKSSIKFIVLENIDSEIIENTGKFPFQRIDSKKAYLNYIEYNN